jgi:hypothetical protein
VSDGKLALEQSLYAQRVSSRYVSKYVTVTCKYRGRKTDIPSYAGALQAHDKLSKAHGGTCNVGSDGDLVTKFPVNGNRSKLEKTVLDYIAAVPARFTVTKVAYNRKGGDGHNVYAGKITVKSILDSLYGR